MPNIVNIPPTIATSAMPVFCRGPTGLCHVLPVVPAQTTVTSYATSLCDGRSMHGLWYYDNSIIQTTNSSFPGTGSWLFVPSSSLIGTAFLPATGIMFTPPTPRPKIVPAAVRAGRRALRRSIDLYARFRGVDEVRRFLHGETIVFEGERYNYRVRKTMNLLRQTMHPEGAHIPYSLQMIDKATDTVLASGCVVFPALPVFDQLLALSFHVRDPEDERKLVATTNWTPVSGPQRRLAA